MVLGTPGVIAMVGNGKQSVSIPDPEIDALHSGIAQCNPEPHPQYAMGEKVSITPDPLASFTGTLLTQKTGARVVLQIEAIMQGVSVDIDVNDLEMSQPMDNKKTTKVM